MEGFLPLSDKLGHYQPSQAYSLQAGQPQQQDEPLHWRTSADSHDSPGPSYVLEHRLRTPIAGSGGLSSVPRDAFSELERTWQTQFGRLQEHLEHLLDTSLRPVEARVSSLDHHQPLQNARLSEVEGALEALRCTSETEVQRVDAVESRFRRWRKVLEDDLEAKHTELRSMIDEAAEKEAEMRKKKPYVTHEDMLDIVDLVKQEMRNIANSSIQKELEPVWALLSSTQEKLSPLEDIQLQVERLQDQLIQGLTPAQRQIAEAADSLRNELQRLADIKSTVDVEVKTVRKETTELSERVRHQEVSFEDIERKMKHLREELTALKARDAEVELLTRSEAEKVAEKTFRRLAVDQTGRTPGRASSIVGSPFRTRRIDEEAFGTTPLGGSSNRASHANNNNNNNNSNNTNNGNNSGDSGAFFEMVSALQGALEALQTRVDCMQQHRGNQAELEERVERTWTAVEEGTMLQLRFQSRLDDLAEDVSALQQAVIRQRGTGGMSNEVSESTKAFGESSSALPNRSGRLSGTESPRSTRSSKRFQEVSDLKAEIARLWRALGELAELSGQKLQLQPSQSPQQQSSLQQQQQQQQQPLQRPLQQQQRQQQQQQQQQQQESMQQPWRAAATSRSPFSFGGRGQTVE